MKGSWRNKAIAPYGLLFVSLQWIRVKQPNPSEDRVRYQPIPISGISAGALADGMGCLGVTIGTTELMFQVPTAAISEVARTLLLVGADEHSQRPS